jgi:hypothetical protein
MECLWRLFRYWQQDGNCYQPHSPVFYVCYIADGRLSYYSLYGAGFLAKYAELYEGSKKKSLVLFIVSRNLFTSDINTDDRPLRRSVHRSVHYSSSFLHSMSLNAKGAMNF